MKHSCLSIPIKYADFFFLSDLFSTLLSSSVSLNYVSNTQELLLCLRTKQAAWNAVLYLNKANLIVRSNIFY